MEYKTKLKKRKAERSPEQKSSQDSKSLKNQEIKK